MCDLKVIRLSLGRILVPEAVPEPMIRRLEATETQGGALRSWALT
jgi:hypothetical protein